MQQTGTRYPGGSATRRRKSALDAVDGGGEEWGGGGNRRGEGGRSGRRVAAEEAAGGGSGRRGARCLKTPTANMPPRCSPPRWTLGGHRVAAPLSRVCCRGCRAHEAGHVDTLLAADAVSSSSKRSRDRPLRGRHAAIDTSHRSRTVTYDACSADSHEAWKGPSIPVPNPCYSFAESLQP